MEYIDSHAHIYLSQFDSDRDDIISACLESGISKIYMPNIDVESIHRMLEAEHRYPGVCIPMMGLHPCEVGREFEKQLYVMEEWLNKRCFSAMGEIGLDLYWDKTLLDYQKEAMRIQINWAKEKGLPIVLHCRESIEETIGVVEELNDGRLTGIFHCFTGSLAQARKIIDMGFLLGVGGVATFKNGGLDKVLPSIGLESLVLETDSPYLAPVPHRGKRNSPEYIPLIARRVAALTESSDEKTAEITTANALEIFHPYESEL